MGGLHVVSGGWAARWVVVCRSGGAISLVILDSLHGRLVVVVIAFRR